MSQLPVLEGSPDAVQVCACGSDPGGGERGGRILCEGDLLVSPHQLHLDHVPAWATLAALSLSGPPCHQGLSRWLLRCCCWTCSALFVPVWLLPRCHAGVLGPWRLQKNGPVLLLTVRYWLFSFMAVVGLSLLSSPDVAAVIWNKMWKGLILNCFFQPSSATEWNSTTNVGKTWPGILHPLKWENSAGYVFSKKKNQTPRNCKLALISSFTSLAAINAHIIPDCQILLWPDYWIFSPNYINLQKELYNYVYSSVQFMKDNVWHTGN